MTVYRLRGLMRGLKVIKRPEPVFCPGLGELFRGTVSHRDCHTPSGFPIQELGDLAQRTVADVRCHENVVVGYR